MEPNAWDRQATLLMQKRPRGTSGPLKGRARPGEGQKHFNKGIGRAQSRHGSAGGGRRDQTHRRVSAQTPLKNSQLKGELKDAVGSEGTKRRKLGEEQGLSVLDAKQQPKLALKPKSSPFIEKIYSTQQPSAQTPTVRFADAGLLPYLQSASEMLECKPSLKPSQTRLEPTKGILSQPQTSELSQPIRQNIIGADRGTADVHSRDYKERINGNIERPPRSKRKPTSSTSRPHEESSQCFPNPNSQRPVVNPSPPLNPPNPSTSLRTQDLHPTSFHEIEGLFRSEVRRRCLSYIMAETKKDGQYRIEISLNAFRVAFFEDSNLSVATGMACLAALRSIDEKLTQALILN